jgi:hypothetical protein
VSTTEHVILGSGDDFVLSLLETLSQRRYEGGQGSDRLQGASSSADTLIGGLGSDVMNGFGGNDVIMAREGTADQAIGCGAGRDRADLDLLDPSPARPDDCETITRRAVNEAALVRIVAARLEDAFLAVRLSCPRGNDRSCVGRLDAAGSVRRYALRRGRSRTVKLPARRAAVRRRSVTVRSVERGRFGAKTVIRQLPVRR